MNAKPAKPAATPPDKPAEAERVKVQRSRLVRRIVHAVAVGDPGTVELPRAAANQVGDTRGAGKRVVD